MTYGRFAHSTNVELCFEVEAKSLCPRARSNYSREFSFAFLQFYFPRNEMFQSAVCSYRSHFIVAVFFNVVLMNAVLYN